MLLTDVGLVSHIIAAVAFTGLAGATLWQRQNRVGLALAVASGVTALWALTFVLAAQGSAVATALLSPAETLRATVWIGFLVAVLRPSWDLDERARLSFTIAGSLGFVATLQLALDWLGATSSLFEGVRTPAAQLFLITRLAVAVTGLVLVHNLYRQADATSRSAGRMLAIGLGGLFVYDLNFYTLAFLLPPPSPDLFNIRGAVDSITVPLMLFAARESWVQRVQVSRQVLFHTLSFSIIGFYLIAMAALAYGLRLAGGNWGLLLQVTFLFATVILGVVVLVSPQFRAALRVQIAKNFFTYKYDYRQEWPRFIATLSRTGERAGTLQERVIQAICAVVDSPGGVLFIPDDNALAPVADWHLKAARLAPVPRDSGLARFLETQQRIIEFDELRADAGDYAGVALPPWAIADRRIWLGVPLIHLDTLAGFIVIERTVAERTLNWEDFDLLRTLGRQAASYIAESSTQVALDEAAKFEEFNRRFAFIIHDVKNLVSQLSLVARNAERHADNPAFRADMVATLQSSVGKMNDLLARLSPRIGNRQETVAERIDLPELLKQVVTVKRHAHPPLTLSLPSDETEAGAFAVFGDSGRIEQLLLHLIQNAIDASTASAPIAVGLARENGMAVVSIADRGSGMSARFIRDDLFRPFHSTKPGGFGIGAHEAREITKAHGGRLDVESQEGEGSTFTVYLPLAVSVSAPANAIAAQ